MIDYDELKLRGNVETDFRMATDNNRSYKERIDLIEYLLFEMVQHGWNSRRHHEY